MGWEREKRVSQQQHEADDRGVKNLNEQHPHRGDWLREIVFGLNDGLVTTLVFIMAVSEVAPARLLLVVLGEVLAGGVSMALGGYLSARTAKQILDQRIATERYEIEHEPDEERAELRLCQVMQIRNGKIVRVHTYYDMMTLREQLGLKSATA